GTLQGLNGYALAYASTGALTVTASTLTVTADALAKISGTPDPALSYSVSGLKAGDAAAAALSGNLLREAGVASGTYRIGQGSLTANGNYLIQYIENFLTITQSAQSDVPAVLQRTVERLSGRFAEKENRAKEAYTYRMGIPDPESSIFCLLDINGACLSIDGL
ncbi:MAG: MBG domain-containing protein, partial [Alphaproteobacteria bacterium]|nr:MBG domain-containing protein [Alphaproteobacteria bacterium]